MNVPAALRLFCCYALLTGGACAAEREVKRTFAVQPGCTLVVDTYRGDIVIEETDATEVRVAVHFDYDVDTEAEADRLWSGLEFELKSEANTVSIVARNRIETGPRFSWRENKRMHLSYRIAVPRQCHLVLKTLTGAITVGRITGRASAQVGNGTIFFRQVDGAIEAAIEAGNLVISRCTGAVNARVLQGTIRVGTIGGPSDLRNSNGGIEVMNATGALTAFAEVGDVTVNFSRETSQPAKLTSSGGNVWVKIDPAANCELEASATWGQVENGLRLSGEGGEINKRRLAGRLNAGGSLLQLRANGGSVKIEAGETQL